MPKPWLKGGKGKSGGKGAKNGKSSGKGSKGSDINQLYHGPPLGDLQDNGW